MDEKPQPSLIRRYQRLIGIASDLASTLDLDDLLRRIVHAGADLCFAQAASILLYDETKQELHFEVASNREEPVLRGLSVPVDSSIAGWIVTHRQPVIISDVQKDQRHFTLVGQVTQITTRSLLGVPLIAKDKVIGVLEAINKLKGEFTQEDQELLTALGAQAAIAIENARLFQQSDLIAELVHELRTPMASLSTATHLLLRPDVPSEQRVRIIEIIQEEIFRLSEMTTAFLDLARMESGRALLNLETFDLNTLLRTCEELLQNRVLGRQLNLNFVVEENLPNMVADPGKVKQVVLNLAENAITYNAPGGEVTIKASGSEDAIILTVTNTGPGIPPESIPHLFEKFYRVPGTEHLESGSGLGLTICKRIVELHGGKIDVFSEEKKGATFTAYFPLENMGQHPGERPGRAP